MPGGNPFDGLTNTAGADINPATEDKQDTIIANQTNGSQKAVRYDSVGREVVQLVSAFAEQVVVEGHPQWQQSFEYTVDNTDLNTNAVAGGGTVTQAEAMAVVTTSTTTASNATLNSTHHAKYKAGFGGMMRFSYLFTAPVAATHQYVGLMDEPGSTAEFINGYAIGFDGTDAVVTRFQNDVQFSVTQANWDDPLDGTGTSGVTMDFTKLNVFYIQFQYLGAGPIYFWTEDPDTGVPFRFHTIKYANQFITPSTFNPNYHFTMHVDNEGTTSNLIGKCASYGYFIEGKTELIEVHQPQFTTGSLIKTGITTEIAIATIRNKANYAGKINYLDIILERFGGALDTNAVNAIGNIRLVKNATIGGTPAWNDINTTNSVVEIDVAGTTVTGGTELLGLDMPGKASENHENVLPYKFIIHPNETVTLAGSSPAGAASIKESLLWKELF